MTAYLIANYDVVDRDAWKDYVKKSTPVMEGGGQVLVFDRASDAREGSAGHQTVVISYPSKEAAQTAYESAAYQAVIGIRLGSTENGRCVIASGVDEPRE